MEEGLLERDSAPGNRATTLITTERTVDLPVPHPNPFASNRISTSRYNCLTFLPKNLWYQFQKLANVYFLVIAILQTIPEISVTGGVPNILFPLLVVLAVSAVKDLLEDYKRKKSDKEENNRKTLRRNNQWTAVHWKDVIVGDIVQVKKDEYFPADMILLTSSESKGICYIETKNLDGETNLKHKIAHKTTVSHFRDDFSFDGLHGLMRAEGPNPMIYQFNGMLSLGESLVVPMTPDQFLLRGSALKNTDWIIGIVIYTGHESKIMLNSSSSQNKFSRLETLMNRQIVYIFLMQLAVCSFCALYYSIWFSRNKHDTNYLDLTNGQNTSPVVQFILMFFSWMLIFTNFVPISLLVTLEVVKFIQGFFIAQDLALYYAETDTPAEVHSSNLNEELGQVSYVFSDKTGTLTCNVMEFRKFTLLGHTFGSDERMDPNLKVPNVDFVDPTFDPSEFYAQEFLLYLAVCHTIVCENTEAGLEYKANSPDELALVSAARFFDVTFIGRDADMNVIVQRGSDRFVVQLLNVIEFTSDRKRMSVVVRMPDNTIKLICKGADSVLMPRLQNNESTQATFDTLEIYGNEGLRTLLIAHRTIAEDEYQRWNVQYTAAMNDIHNRDALVAKAGEAIEQQLSVIGATAIEDKLQDRVPECIETLRNSGVKVWMLTGDKVETAINIGFSCALLVSSMVRIEIVARRSSEVSEELKNGLLSIQAAPEKEFALIISGDALLKAVLPGSKGTLMTIIDFCKVVIACRVSPQQKADIVTMIRTAKPTVCTLGIGDGANDVNMILAAHVGVGISGLEGKQAVRAADYAISQFAFLQRLLFVHGRESYRKNATLICYNFYKNVLLVMPLFFYGLFSAFSGQSLYNSWTYQTFNIFFASLPIILYAVFDKEISYDKLETTPMLYKLGLKGKLFNTWVFWGWILEATFQALIITLVTSFAVYGNPVSNGFIPSIWVGSCMIFAMVVILANLKVFLFSYKHYWFTVSVLLFSVLIYFFISFLLTDLLPILSWLDNYDSRGSTSQMVANPNFYIGVLLLSVSAFLLQPIIDQSIRLYKLVKRQKAFPESVEISDIEEVKPDVLQRESLENEEYLRAQDSLRRFSGLCKLLLRYRLCLQRRGRPCAPSDRS